MLEGVGYAAEWFGTLGSLRIGGVVDFRPLKDASAMLLRPECDRGIHPQALVVCDGLWPPSKLYIGDRLPMLRMIQTIEGIDAELCSNYMRTH